MPNPQILDLTNIIENFSKYYHKKKNIPKGHKIDTFRFQYLLSRLPS